MTRLEWENSFEAWSGTAGLLRSANVLFTKLSQTYNIPRSSRVNMPRCKNCDSFVTDDYVRVFAPDDLDGVRVCPNCEDKLRDGAEIRDARSTRQN